MRGNKAFSILNKKTGLSACLLAFTLITDVFYAATASAPRNISLLNSS